MGLIRGIPESNQFYKNDSYGLGGELNVVHDELSKMEILHEVGLAITQLLDLEKILEFSVDILVNKLGMEECLFYLWNEEEERFILRHQYGVKKKIQKRIDERRKSGLDFVKNIAETRKAIYIPNLGEDDRFTGDIQLYNANYFYLGVPLISRNLVIGVLEIMSPKAENHSGIDLAFFTTLGRSIAIAIDNALLVAEIQNQKQIATSLFQLSTNITSVLSLKEVLGEIANVARLIMNADIGMVGLYQQSCNEIKILATAGDGAAKLDGLTINVSEDLPGHCLFQKKEFKFPSKEKVKIQLHNDKTLQDYEIQSYLAVPLHHGESFIGLVEIMDRKQRKFSTNDVLLLKQLGYHIFVAVEDARLHEQLRYGATLEEQNRLARELHDHLAQAMGFIKIKAIMVKEQLSLGNQDKATNHLDEMINTTSVLYTDLREAIFNLRNTEAEQGNFLLQLQSYLQEYEQYYGLEVRLSVDDRATTEFSAEVANQLMRIIQEALSNVRRHACAQHVWIRFQQLGGEIEICIEDDGNGFDTDAIRKDGTATQSFGLQIMEERISYIDGKMNIVSQPGKGTKVCLKIPSVFIR